jgi:flagellar protein FlgJ
MANTLQHANVYTDFKGLAELRRQSRANTPEAIKKVAKQFESLFMQMMLKSMRDAAPVKGMFDSNQSRIYNDMYDKQLSINMSQRGGFGLAEMLAKQLSGEAIQARVIKKPDVKAYLTAPVSNLSVAPKPQENKTAPVVDNRTIEKTVAQKNVKVAISAPVAENNQKLEFNSPDDFVNFVWKYAKEVANQYGLNAKAIMAQAALETGWGKHVMKHADGSSSFNLFGIKADQRWNGERVTAGTLEFKDGVMQKETASFRAYSSIREAINDYAKFLVSNDRYQDVVKSGGNAERYADSLQKAGYATDPQYSQKIKRILGSGVIENAIKQHGI